MFKILKIQFEAIKFLDRVNKLTVKNMEHWLIQKGYSLHFFTEDEAEKLGIDKDEKGFKRKSELLKIIYVNSSLSYKEKLETIIHEVGHVLFDDMCILKSNNHIELQANMFAEYVANPNKILQKIYKVYKARYKILISLLLLICSVYMIVNNSDNETIKETNIIPQTVKSETLSEKKVCITPTGKRFHTYDCFSIRNSNKIEITVEKAIQDYTPCKLCKPNK